MQHEASLHEALQTNGGNKGQADGTGLRSLLALGHQDLSVPVYRLHDMMTQVIVPVGKHDARMEFEPSSSVSFLCLQALALPFRQHFQRRTPSLLCHSGCGLSTHPAGRTYNTQWILREEKGRLRQPGV